MKMDMANFTIQQIRPYIQQQSVDYEKEKFEQFLKKQQGMIISLLFKISEVSSFMFSGITWIRVW